MPSAGIEWQPPERPLDEEKKKQRAERFGVEYTAPDDTGLMDVDLFEERKEAPLDAPRRPEAVHIYGVDLLSTSDLLKYFAEYGPSYVEWINDSSANVLFRDAPTAKRAIAGLGKPLPPEELPEGVDAADPANIEYLWHKGEDFQKGGSSIPLIFRTATVLDAKPSERVQSRRLWLAVGGAHGEGRGRGRGRGRKFRVRRGSEGEAMPRGPTGYGEHDDRVAAAPEGGGQWEDGEGVGRRKGRGAMRYKRKSGDAAMVDAMELEESAPQRARVDDREQVTYGDLS